MSKFPQTFKNIIQWILAAILAFVIANLLIFSYWHAPGWITRDTGATFAIYRSGSLLRNGYEGHGTAHVDSHGYLNPDLPLADSYVLVLGCSHTKAIEVAEDEKYTALLNAQLSGGDDSHLYVYNLAIDGFYYPDIIKGLSAALEEFPDAHTVILELPTTDYAPELLLQALDSRGYDASQTGSSLYDSLSAPDKGKIFLKETMPLVSLYLSKQFVPSEEVVKIPFLYTPEDTDPDVFDVPQEVYTAALEPTLAYIRQICDKEVIIYYHPGVSIGSDGNLMINRCTSADWFATACDRYGIPFVDASDAFLQKYNENHTVPYGFDNTSPGTGHLNTAGHRISAELLYQALTGENQ